MAAAEVSGSSNDGASFQTKPTITTKPSGQQNLAFNSAVGKQKSSADNGQVLVGADQNGELLASKTVGGAERNSRVYADPRELLDIDKIVIHETTRGFMEYDDPSAQDYIVKKTNVNTDTELAENSDFVIMQDGAVYQQNTRWGRQDTSIGSGIGTVVENGGPNGIEPGSALDIEIDYRGGEPTTVGRFFQSSPIQGEQYTATAQVVADAAKLKHEALVAASRRGEDDTTPILSIEPHRYTDRNIEGAHQDPTDFDNEKFMSAVRQELEALGLPPSLVEFNGWDMPVEEH